LTHNDDEHSTHEIGRVILQKLAIRR